MGNSSPDVVVFFDFENIVYSLRNREGQNPNFELLMDKCQEYGRVVLARAYADWVRHSSLIAPLQSSGFDPVYVPTFVYADGHSDRKTRKNAVDINIAIDAIEVLFTQPHIQTYILLSGDKDFVPLAHKLRRYGKRVIFLGIKGTTSTHVRQAVDDLIFYHELTDEFSSEQKPPPDIYKELKKAVKSLSSAGKPTDLYSLEHTLSELLGSFDVRQHKDQEGKPFRRFRDLILEAQRHGHVRLVTSGVVHEVHLASGKPKQAPPTPLAELAVEPPPPRTELEAAFDLLVEAAAKARAEEKSARAANIKNVMRRMDKDFNEKTLKNEKGEHFTNFSEFVSLASEHGYVNISGKGIYLEIVPADKQAPAPKPLIIKQMDGEQLPAAPAANLLETQKEVPVIPEIRAESPAETFQPAHSGANALPSADLQPAQPSSEEPSSEEPSSEEPPAGEPPSVQIPGEEVSLVKAAQKELLPDNAQTLDQSEQVLQDDEELASPSAAAPSPGNPAVDQREPGLPDELDAHGIPIAESALPPGIEYRRRALVVDALRSCQYPAQPHDIATYIRQLRERRQVYLPDNRLYQLISAARELGLINLVQTDAPDTAPYYIFKDDPDLVRRFIEV